MSFEATGEYEMVGGMIAAESPQRIADRLLELIRRGDVDRVRAIVAARAARAAEAVGRELAAAEESG